MKRLSLIATATLMLGACASTGVPSGGGAMSGAGGGFIQDLPDQVVAMAGPNQDLNAVKLMPDDGCYWYRHVGPVETTMLPLLSVSKRHICTQKPAAAAGPAPA